MLFPLLMALVFVVSAMASADKRPHSYKNGAVTELPEVYVESAKKRMLYILAYTREYSTLTSYPDTITLFREKLIDFMLTDNPKKRDMNHTLPRILSSKSYYRFTNADGLDSVSDRCNHHYTWSDWIGIPPTLPLPLPLVGAEKARDTLMGKYSPAEVWIKNNDTISVEVDLLAGDMTRKWTPQLSAFLKNDVDFDHFRMNLDYANVLSDSISARDIAGYSFNIESVGRGHAMFRFNHRESPFYVTTNTEVYILDKSLLTFKDARKMLKKLPEGEELEMLTPQEAPMLDSATLDLITRVEALDPNQTRLMAIPDKKLINAPRQLSTGQKILGKVKDIFGVSQMQNLRPVRDKWKKYNQK